MKMHSIFTGFLRICVKPAFKKIHLTVIALLFFTTLSAQQKKDTAIKKDSSTKKDTGIKVEGKYITLSEIVVNSRLDVPSFIERVKNDTTFYKAFRNLHIIGYTSLNDMRMLDKKGSTDASLQSRTKQVRTGNCRKMQLLQETATGDMYDHDHNFNYYT